MIQRLVMSVDGVEVALDPAGCSLQKAHRTFHLGAKAYQHLVQHLGQGYGDKFFTLTWGDERLEGCTVDDSDGTVGYLRLGGGGN